jgi:hypothetical protein
MVARLELKALLKVIPKCPQKTPHRLRGRALASPFRFIADLYINRLVNL